MKFISIHADFIEFEAIKKALKKVEDKKGTPQKIEECLVILTAVEKRDEKNTEAIIKQYVKEIKDIAEQVKAENIVLYPYAHLSSNLASPSKAQKVLKDAEKELSKDFKVTRAPFGWYKSFDLKCKGHPLSELSREFGPDEVKDEVSEALKAEEKLKSYWYIIDTEGKLHEIRDKDGEVTGFDFTKHENLKKFAQYEISKVRAVTEEPPHVKYMKKLELVDYEPGSDPGNLRYYPKGRFIKGLIEETVNRKMNEYGAMEVETPIMYDYEHPSLKSYMNRFPARQYTIQTPNKKVFLRFAACMGQFLIGHDMTVSYKQLPLKMYELTRYSFRVEQHGELTGLRRLRAFTMPDCHGLCADIEQAKEEMLKRFQVAWELQEQFGMKMPDDFEFAIRITKKFYEKNKDFILTLVKRWGKPAVIEMWDEQFFYFVMKYEWNFVDALNKASALTTDQIDVENSKRYGLEFTDKDGKKKNFTIMHMSPSGAVERVMYALLEKAYFDQKAGKKPMLPLWLSPTQIRLIPVSVEKHLEACEKFADELEKHNIRVDIDDDEKTLGRRIVSAEQEWIPYVLVIGDKELEDDKLMARIRETNEQKEITIKDLCKEIKDKTKNNIFKPRPLPRHISKIPSFFA